MLLRYQLPRMIERGVTQTLDADVYSDAGAQQTPSAITLTLTAGGTEHLSAVSATAAAPSTYSLADSVTDGQPLSTLWYEVWAATISGTVYTFRRPAYLVRHVLYPVITDTDLTDRHSDLLDLIDPDQTTFEAQRAAAWHRVNKWLIRQGNRPQLVLDSYALADLHVAETLSDIWWDMTHSAAGANPARVYREQAERWDKKIEEARDIELRYDFDEDGTPDAGEKRVPTGTLFFSHPPEYR